MLVTMSDKELSRINVIQSVVEKRIRCRDAAHQFALTERQTRPFNEPTLPIQGELKTALLTKMIIPDSELKIQMIPIRAICIALNFKMCLS